ncbi:hypothetical protein [Paenibacillus sp. FSL H3-0286]|uniref:hypothetical protein n=1 Tax=Paenibacillus sp. FSL H3-0286 TaxID=2921427 RepID=UPI00324CAC9D
MATRTNKTKLEENTLVYVVSNFDGVLTYKCPRSGESWLFKSHGASDTMTVGQIRTMLSQKPKYIEKGWIKVDNEEVIQFLNLNKYVKNTLTKDDFERLFEEEPEKIEEVLTSLESDYSKISAFDLARDKYVNGKLRDHFVIRAIEKSLGQKLDPNS